MKFLSTRGKSQVENASEAIVKGLADDGGLFVPEKFPDLSKDLNKLVEMDYSQRASFVIGSFLSEYDAVALQKGCDNAYSKFEDGDPAPIVKVDDGFYIMELFHGPTIAFKDVALTLLPYLLRTGADFTGIKEEILILVATSGDTGKAALEGFKDQKGIKICVFYPSEGVSDMQKLQMCTQEGENVKVVAVKGNFDDCQTAVKKIFNSNEINQKLKEQNVILSSANSINFGRLVPQITYYFSAYCDLVNSNEIKVGDKVNFVVPTGNFGNILAGYYAKQMGLPVGTLVCASNDNNVLTEFFADGTYDANREFYKTTSPSMDILISSNLERLIFEISNRDATKTAKRMEDLKKTGKYDISKEELDKLSLEFYADYSDAEEGEETISEIFEEYGYVCDPHTAVAVNVFEKFRKFNKNNQQTVVLSTASPYKFPQSVLKAITGKTEKDAFKSADRLYNETAMPIPQQISSLKQKERRFSGEVEKDAVIDEIFSFIKK